MTGGKQEFATEVAAVTSGALHAVLERAAELGIEVTAAQVANMVPNLAEVSAELLAYARSHNGCLDGAKLAFVPTVADNQQVDDTYR